MDLDKDPMDGIDVLRACVWLDRAFNSLRNSKTIIGCFEKAGFVMRDEVLESDCEASVMAVPEGSRGRDPATDGELLGCIGGRAALRGGAVGAAAPGPGVSEGPRGPFCPRKLSKEQRQKGPGKVG